MRREVQSTAGRLARCYFNDRVKHSVYRTRKKFMLICAEIVYAIKWWKNEMIKKIRTFKITFLVLLTTCNFSEDVHNHLRVCYQRITEKLVKHCQRQKSNPVALQLYIELSPTRPRLQLHCYKSSEWHRNRLSCFYIRR